MKLVSPFLLTAVSAGRIRRSPQAGASNAAAPANTWTYIESPSEVLEGNYYMIGGQGTADEAHAFCASQGGFAPLSRTPAVLSVYNSFPNVNGAYWSGFKKVNSVWQVFQSADPANTGTPKQPWAGSTLACDGFMHGGTTVCAKPLFRDGQWCINQEDCDWQDATILCLKNADAPTETTAPPPPAEINNVVDAWNDMVVFPNASTHGCQCLNLLSDSDQRYPGKPRDELDRVCLDWQNAIKCQRFEGGVCGPAKEEDLPSYTNYANCTLNVDPCAIALCEINRKFATDVNNLNGVIVPTEVENPVTSCTRANVAPNYDSCCFTDIFSSIRYNSVGQQCVNGTVETNNPSTNVACQRVVQDVLFIMDASGSVNDQEWQLQLQFTRDMAKEIGLYAGGSRAAVMQFSSQSKQSTNIAWTDDAASFDSRIMNIVQRDGSTYIQAALNYAYNNLIRGQKRPGIPLNVYWMADGDSSDFVTGIPGEGTEFDKAFSLGIGPSATYDELVAGASSPASTYVSNNISFNNLSQNVERFATNLCQNA